MSAFFFSAFKIIVRSRICEGRLLVEISFQQSCENRTVTGFVLCHFVNGVVNGVVAQLFCALCDFEFSGAFSLFGALNSACAKKAGA